MQIPYCHTVRLFGFGFGFLTFVVFRQRLSTVVNDRQRPLLFPETERHKAKRNTPPGHMGRLERFFLWFTTPVHLSRIPFPRCTGKPIATTTSSVFVRSYSLTGYFLFLFASGLKKLMSMAVPRPFIFPSSRPFPGIYPPAPYKKTFSPPSPVSSPKVGKNPTFRPYTDTDRTRTGKPSRQIRTGTRHPATGENLVNIFTKPQHRPNVWPRSDRKIFTPFRQHDRTFSTL